MKRWLGAIAIAIAVVLLSSWYLRERQKILAEQPTAWTTDTRADCAVVLTGGPGRIRSGFDLLAQGRVRKLIVSGVYPGAELRDIFPQWPFYGPISEDDVALEKRSSTTYGNAQQSLPLVEALRCRDIVLVTSRVHIYRAMRIFRTVFPAEIKITPRAIVATRLDPGFGEIFLETIKSLFYSMWAY